MKSTVFRLALKSIRYRRSTILMSVVSIALSVMLLLGVERIRASVEESFTSTIAGTDLIVGARTGNLSLLLSTVFHIGNASQNVSWESYDKISHMAQVDWTIPIALGDSHKGYPVIGTTAEFFEHYKYSANIGLSASSGEATISNMKAVVGYEVAKRLNYSVGDFIELTHGMGSEDITKHEDDPFEISGVLTATGTPVDNSVLISLTALDHIHDAFYNYEEENVSVFGGFEYNPKPRTSHNHEDGDAHDQEHEGGHNHEDGDAHDHEHEEGHNHEDGDTHDHVHEEGHDHEDGDGHDHEHEEGHDHEDGDMHDHEHGEGHDHEDGDGHDHEHEESHDHEYENQQGHGHDHAHGESGSITGFFLGVKNKSDILGLQRTINENEDEALLAILPVITLLELWNIINPIETILLIISLLVLFVSLGSVLTAIVSSLNQRRREMAVLRSVGAHPRYIFGLIIIESTGIVLTGIILGAILLIVGLIFAKPILQENFGMIMEISSFSQREFLIVLAIFIAGVLVGLLPAFSSYKRTLADGLTIKT